MRTAVVVALIASTAIPALAVPVYYLEAHDVSPAEPSSEAVNWIGLLKDAGNVADRGHDTASRRELYNLMARTDSGSAAINWKGLWNDGVSAYHHITERDLVELMAREELGSQAINWFGLAGDAAHVLGHVFDHGNSTRRDLYVVTREEPGSDAINWKGLWTDAQSAYHHATEKSRRYVYELASREEPGSEAINWKGLWSDAQSAYRHATEKSARDLFPRVEPGSEAIDWWRLDKTALPPVKGANHHATNRRNLYELLTRADSESEAINWDGLIGDGISIYNHIKDNYKRGLDQLD